MKIGILLLIISIISACTDDTVITEFTDMQQAQAEHAFEKGWLPPILPPTTKNILQSNNLDLSIGTGSFNFSPLDFKSFENQGARIATEQDLKLSTQKKMLKNGFHLLKFSSQTTQWLIAIHPNGQGYYWVESIK